MRLSIIVLTCFSIFGITSQSCARIKSANHSSVNPIEFALQDVFFGDYKDKGIITLSLHQYSNDGFCSHIQSDFINCVDTKIDTNQKYIELFEYTKTDVLHRFQFLCHAPNLTDKIFSCSVMDDRGRLSLKSKFVDEK